MIPIHSTVSNLPPPSLLIYLYFYYLVPYLMLMLTLNT